MSARQKLACYCVTGSLLLIYLAGPSGHAGEDQNKTRTVSSQRLRGLLEERYEILKTVVQEKNRLADAGRISAGEVAKATVAMLYAEADLRPTHSERIEIHEKIVATLRECEKLIARETDRGLTSSADVVRAKLARLKAQIKLEKMKLAQQTSQ
ncbi:MAG: hypothetical protein AMJ65_05525 [Phycisphaerae bacterium SG8_4]|nr:MAG: hypothetical protein AMJ65_05525 [Phycisphaerae bacterium SG8_4]